MLLAVPRPERARAAGIVIGTDQRQIDPMIFQLAKLGCYALARSNKLFGFRVGDRAYQEEGGKPRRRFLLGLVVAGSGGNQGADQLAGTRHAIVVDAAAMRVAEQEAAIGGDTVGIGSARAGDQQGCNRY